MTYCLAAVRSQCSLSRQPNPYWDAPRKVSCCRCSAAWARALAALPAVLGRAERCERSADLVSSASERSTAASLRACSSTSMKITLAAASIRPLCREAAGLPDARAVRRRHDLVPAPVPSAGQLRLGSQLVVPTRPPRGYCTAVVRPSYHAWAVARGGGDKNGQAIQGRTVEGRKHVGLRLLEQGRQEQGRINSWQGLRLRPKWCPPPA